MSYEYLGAMPIDYDHCHYGNPKLTFRGPKGTITPQYWVAIGGTETFGKYVEDPYPAQLEMLTGRSVINLGCMHASLDFYLKNPAILDICRNAEGTIVQMTGPQNMCNRFYKVHPVHNDRFINVTPLLHSIYPDLDFTEVHYTGHLLKLIRQRSAARYDIVRQGLQSEWLVKMKDLLTQIGEKVLLLWMADHLPGTRDEFHRYPGDPTMLSRDMIDQLLGDEVELIEVVATPDEIAAGHERMIFMPWEDAAAREMLGPIVHQEVARQIQNRLPALQ